MKKGSVEWRVLEILCEQFDLSFKETKRDFTGLDIDIVMDFSADCRNFIDLASKFGTKFNIELSEAEVSNNTMFSEIVVLIEAKLLEEKVLTILWDQMMVVNPDEIGELRKRDFDIVEDLGADNVDILELIITFEDEFKIRISDQEMEGKTRFSEILDLIAQKLVDLVGQELSR